MVDYKTKSEVFIDKKLLNSKDTVIINNSKPETNMYNNSQSTNKQNFTINTLTAKIFEMNAGAIAESILLQEGNTKTNNFFDYDDIKSKQSIIVITDDFNKNELLKLNTKLNDNLHTIVYYGENRHNFTEIFKKITKRISVSSFSNAVTKAYQLVKDGQTIIFPKIDCNFELFAHLEFA